ncbi:MAG: PLP-dependent aspartate aminotransferase family protein [Planctomycetota bacterium]
MHPPLYGTPAPDEVPLGALSQPLDRASTAAQPDADTVRALGAGERRAPFYQRLCHPNGVRFESLVAAREGADGAVAFASGMAAMSAALLAHLSAGDRVLIAREIYGGTDALATHDLPRFGIDVERFPALAAGALERALQRPARAVVFETPINPTLRLVDLRAVADLCRARGALSIVDGTFAPPPVQQPLAHGVDLVVHSATKFYGGHSDVLAGVVAGRHELLGPIEGLRRRTGGVLGPDAAWLLCRSYPTMDLRLAAQQAAALELAGRLGRLPAAVVRAVHHPGLDEHPDHALASRQMRGGGTMLSFEVEGGLPRARAVFDRFERFARAPSLGGVESLASLPAYTTHASLTEEARRAAGIPEGLVRLSVGLEGVEVLWGDLLRALGVV